MKEKEAKSAQVNSTNAPVEQSVKEVPVEQAVKEVPTLAELAANGWKVYESATVRNVNLHIENQDEITDMGEIIRVERFSGRMALTFKQYFPQYRGGVGENWTLDTSNKVLWFNLTAVQTILRESGVAENFGADILTTKPTFAKLLLAGAKCTIVAKEVKAGSPYNNPFSRTEKIGDSAEHDTIEYHICNIELTDDNIKRLQMAINTQFNKLAEL